MIKKFDEFVNEGMMSKMWRELDGTDERKEEVVILNIEGVKERHSFTDKNKVFHKNGYLVEGNNALRILSKLIMRLIEIRGNECDLNDIDVSNISDFTNLFTGTDFNGDISGWDVSSAESFSNMFFYCPFNKDISKWNVSSVRNFDNMFAGREKVIDRTNINISEWKPDANNPHTSMDYMFSYTIIDEDFHNWKIWGANKYTKKKSMFLKCENKNQCGIPKWYNDER